VAWAGVITRVEEAQRSGTTVWDLYVEHHYWTWNEGFGMQSERALLSARGEGGFRCRGVKSEGASTELTADAEQYALGRRHERTSACSDAREMPGTNVAAGRRQEGRGMSPSAGRPACPRCGSTNLELISASRDGETADETTVQQCLGCGERFTITAKID